MEPPISDLLARHEFDAAAERIGPWVMRTPLVPLMTSGVLVKAECLQRTGAFKLRGAVNSLLHLDPDTRAHGVVAHSSGNHAMAVACAAQMFGCPATIVMPIDAPSVKIAGTRACGAEVVLVGPASDERAAVARSLATERGLSPIEPYDSAQVVAATGTIALEILADRPDTRVIYVPLSGGGLAAGVARAAALVDPTVRVVGVEPEVAADALASRSAGHRVSLPADQMARTIADGLRVQQVGVIPWAHIEAHVDEIVTVSEEEILGAMAVVVRDARLVAEPSGAVAVAAAMVGRGALGVPPGQRVAVLSGGNVDPGLLADALTRTPATVASRPSA